ncbi:nitroreductase family deazaflavin-dependent oxidoreductase [Streptomyces sp. NPDC089919]|uniref:nitroreductase family deazaflavin-dependent oxidoreductase n=1 Tax=Streptomyces sp. NPDC089919 TaxID=3155188 RepID=UPI00343B52AE
MNAQPATPAEPSAPAPKHYVQAGPIARRFNVLVGRMARHGISLGGAAELSVRGRTSGQLQRIPVNPLEHGGARYLVSARGHSQWVRNMRAAGGGELRVGRRVRTFTAVELPDAEKADLLRVYLERWGWEVNAFFKGVTAKSSEAELLAAAPDHPVFRITLSD